MFRRSLLKCAPIFLATLAVVATGPFSPSQSLASQIQQVGCSTFQETGKSLCGRFLQYWQTHGQVAQQGFPITNAGTEVSDIDGKTYVVQYFERAVFEYHPENAVPNDVLLSLLGFIRYDQKYPGGTSGQTPNTEANSVPFSQTGKRIGGLFLDYWKAHGGLAQQGLPVSDEFSETSDVNGQTYKVQYFERAVFEWHPENAAPYNILLSQLGSARYGTKYSSIGSTLPPANPPDAVASTPAPPSASGPVEVQTFARTLANKYNRVGGRLISFETVRGFNQDGVAYIDLYLTAASSLTLLQSATREELNAWGNAVLPDAQAAFPSTEFRVELGFETYSSHPCFSGCVTECYYQAEDFDASEGGWYTVYTDVVVKNDGVTVCD